MSGMRRGHVSSPTSLEMPSGTFVELLGPHPDDIHLSDVAHNLAAECRYGGSCMDRFSVAEHAVLVARRLREVGADPVTVLAGLHHDDPEAYLKDLPRPLKVAMEVEPLRYAGLHAYKAMTEQFELVIRHALDLDVKQPDGSMVRGSAVEVKEADNWATGVEALLMPSKGRGWAAWVPGPEELLSAHSTLEEVRQLFPWDARQLFLEEDARCRAEAGAPALR